MKGKSKVIEEEIERVGNQRSPRDTDTIVRHNINDHLHIHPFMLVYHLYVIMRETRLLTLRNKAHYTTLKAVFNHSV